MHYWDLIMLDVFIMEHCKFGHSSLWNSTILDLIIPGNYISFGNYIIGNHKPNLPSFHLSTNKVGRTHIVYFYYDLPYVTAPPHDLHTVEAILSILYCVLKYTGLWYWSTQTDTYSISVHMFSLYISCILCVYYHVYYCVPTIHKKHAVLWRHMASTGRPWLFTSCGGHLKYYSATWWCMYASHMYHLQII